VLAFSEVSDSSESERNDFGEVMRGFCLDSKGGEIGEGLRFSAELPLPFPAEEFFGILEDAQDGPGEKVRAV